MGRLLIALGIILIIAAAAYLFFMISGIENNSIAPMMESVLCEDNESYSRIMGDYSYNAASGSYGRSVVFFCTDSEGEERDVTLGAVGVIGGGFTALLLLSMGLIFWGAKKLVQQKTQDMLGAFQNFDVQGVQQTVFDLRNGSYQESQQSQIPPEKMEQIQQILGQVGTMFGGGQETLTERLQELEEARNKGLISESEYRQVRQAILDSLDD